MLNTHLVEDCRLRRALYCACRSRNTTHPNRARTNVIFFCLYSTRGRRGTDARDHEGKKAVNLLVMLCVCIYVAHTTAVSLSKQLSAATAVCASAAYNTCVPHACVHARRYCTALHCCGKKRTEGSQQCSRTQAGSVYKRQDETRACVGDCYFTESPSLLDR